MTELHDIVIVGGGPVGATLALALRDYGLSVVVLEARAQAVGSRDPRALALAQGSRLILQRLGIWEALSPVATSIHTIHVSQRGRFGRTVLHAHEEGLEALGYVLPYAALTDAFDKALSQTGGVRFEYQATAKSVVASEERVVVHFEQAGIPAEIQARLIVVADGGRSLRDLPGMRREVREYGHSAVVAQVDCEIAHGGIAYERFTSEGPLALLPQGERGFALVWTAEPAYAEALCHMPEPEFLELLHTHFGDRVGRFLSVRNRNTFPLRLVTLRPVVSRRLAVIGNAAQTLHPVAGQGFNLGLRDAWELADIIRRTPLHEIGSKSMLDTYRRARGPDTGGGILFTDFLVRAFSNDFPGWGVARGAGLALLELCAPAKRLVTRKMSYGARG